MDRKKTGAGALRAYPHPTQVSTTLAVARFACLINTRMTEHRQNLKAPMKTTTMTSGIWKERLTLKRAMR